MCFPIEFTKSSGSYDFISLIINFTGNAAVVAVGGISLGIIANLALKALGFGAIATSITTAIPVSIGVIAGGAAIVGGGFVLYMAYSSIRAMLNR